MKITKAPLKTLAIASIIGLATSQAIAGSTQITVPSNGTPETFHGGGVAPNIDDNTTMQANGLSTYTGQAWDLEAFTATTVTGSALDLVSGYDLSAHNGNYFGGSSTAYDGTGGGDIFISLSGGATDMPNSGSAYAQYVNNTAASGGNASTTIYDYVIDTHEGLNNSGTLNVYALTASSILTGVANPGLNSNPWIYQPTVGQTAAFTVSYNYALNQTAAQAAALTGVGSMNLLRDDGSSGGNGIYPWSQQLTNGMDHNVLLINMSNLSAALSSSNSIYFSYTMECGNDSIKGLSSGGFSQVPVPDGSSTLILLGSALTLLQFVRRKQAA